jgi:peptidoglycan-associated lipoprotein
MKKTALLLSFAAFCGLALNAQPINRSTPEANLKSAQTAEENGNPYEALDLYEKVYDSGKDKAIALKIAELEYALRDYERAERAFGRIVTRDRKQEYTDMKYWYAMSMKYNGKYAEAADMFNQYISEGKDQALVQASKRELAGCEAAKKAKPSDNLLINNLGKKANSPQTEASPSYSGGELYYTSMQAKEVITPDGKSEDWYMRVYSAAKSAKEYGEPTALGTQINREGWHQGNVSVTADGRTMYFTRVMLSEKGQTVAESKIYCSLKGADGWSGANEVTGVNGDYIAKHPCEGELFGEKVLFFVANMPGGKGGFDIYYAPKKSDGVFGLPVNLSEVVNTVGEEASPFYQDGKLYFSSNGRPSFGGLDVFESQWNGSVWSEPKNMGLGVNSSVDDMYYTRSNDGYSGFLVSNRPGPNNLKSKTCCDDIYAWEIERVKVNLLAKTFRFKRKGEKENQPLTNCSVQVFDVTDKNPANVESKTNATANDFSFSLLPEKSYMAIATREGYQPDTVTFNTVGVKKSKDVEKTMTLRVVRKEPETRVVKTNEPIRLDNILYDYDKWDIRTDAEPDLQYLTELLQKYPDMKIELSSHTDARGRDDYNENLSQKRAESAKNWVVAKGIASDRIVAKGYGEKQLQNGCSNGVECSEEQHQQNRRTEFKIIAGPTSITIERIEKVDPNEDKDKKGQPPGGKQSVKPLFFYEQH